jgi:putative CRISPR-associated protein (TIGR02619 family)
MKYSHIVSVGTSILTNYCRKNSIDQKQLDMSRLLHDKTFVNELVAFVNKDPKRTSTELNALYSYLEKFDVQIDEAYLILTDTDECELCGRVLERVLRQERIDVHIKRVQGYNIKGGDFYEGLVELLKTIAEKVKSWKDRKIYFNATGGFKPEASLLVTIGSTLEIPTYYRHEIIGDTVEIPPFPIMLEKDVVEKLEPFIQTQSGRLYSMLADELLLKNHLIQPIHGERGEIRGYGITSIGKLMWSLWRVVEELK